MEDLKKQTAIRLAQEQQHRQGQGRYPGGNGGGGTAPNQYFPSQDPCLANDPSYSNGGNGVVHPPHPSTNSHQYPTPIVSPYHSTPNTCSVGSFASIDNGPAVLLMPAASGRGTPYNNNNISPALAPRVDTRTSPTFSCDRNQSSARVQASFIPSPSPSSKYRPTPNDRSPDVHVSSYSFGRTSSSTSQESATQSKQQKSKLPHGLTVQELKEMTKARLQAEASVDRVDESTTRRNIQTPEPFASSDVNMDPTLVSRTASQASPVPPGFQTPRDAWSQDSRAEAWDNASVSTCASDAYLSSSEYPSCIGVTQNFDDYNATPFVRSRSYPVSSSGNFDVPSQVHAAPCGASGNNHPYYDGSMGYGQNRRRAQTLSPRVGLSYVHEDRPVLGDAAHISFPQAHPQQSRQRNLPVRSQSAFTPSPFRYGHSNNNNGSTTNANSGVFGGDVGSSTRHRALSTTSLPTISTTADEFGIEQTTASSSRFTSQFGAVREDAPLTTPGFADVFRGSGFGTVASSSSSSPPGLMCGTEGLGISTSSSGGAHLYPAGNIGDSRNRAATWSEPSSDMFSGLMCNEQLSDDLASILKLSGASEEKSGWEQLFSRSPGM